jgi:hypothetical protein
VHGRSCVCLLALTSLILAPDALRGQNSPDSARTDSGRDATLSFPPPLAIQLPAPEPERPEPGFPPRPWPRPVASGGSTPGAFAFPQLVRAAGMIFSGTVISIARHPATRGQAIETVAITFRVEDAIRGTAPGATLTVSQWIGLWSGGQHYRVGQRLLLFLYPPSKLGLTSCVAGPLGRFAVDPLGRVSLSAQHLSAFHKDPVLGGKSRVSLSDFASAVRQASEEE